MVYSHLKKLPINLNILELNCGTGEDAIWFANKGNTILATDISKEMLIIAKQKADSNEKIKFEQLDINKIDSLFIKNNINKFDLIFSNFGGLNCLSYSQLKIFFENASKLLNNNGKIICVMMPKNSIWENNYLLLTGKLKQLFRRNTNDSIDVKVGESIVKTWYYNPKEIAKITVNKYNIESIKPIGFFIPPSYLESFYKKHLSLLKLLNWMERFIKNLSFLSRYSDHYIISLKLK